MKNIVTLLLIFLSLGVLAQKMEVEVFGGVPFDGTNLVINNAGSDFSSSAVMQSTAYLRVTSRSQWDRWGSTGRSWRIDVRKEDINWNNDLKLEIARTGDGNWWYYFFYGSKVYGGMSYQTIANNSTYFFRGSGILSDIPIRLRLSGFSVTQGANNFETNVVLTIYDD